MRRLLRATAALAVLLALGAGTARSQPHPGPSIPLDGPVDVDQLLQVTRIREAMSARVIQQYTFRQSTTIETIDEQGRVRDTETRVYQVVPTPQGTQRHLIAKDGREPPPDLVRKQEKRNAKLRERIARQRERREREARRAAEEQAARSARSQPSPAPAASSAPARPTVMPPPVAAAQQASTTAATSPTTPPAAEHAPPPTDAPGTGATAGPPAPATAAESLTRESLTRESLAQESLTPATPAPAPPPAPPIPPCDEEDVTASLRPPPPGSVVHSRIPLQLAPEQERRRREQTSQYSLFELLSLTDFEYAGACVLGDRVAHVVTFEPPESFDPLNPVERVVSAMAGTILIDAHDFQVARAEAATVAPITWGAGMVKLRAASVLFEYVRVNDEVWLPLRDVFEFQTRVLMAKDHERITHAFDDFRKATTEIETSFDLAPPTGG